MSSTLNDVLPANLRSFITLTELDDAELLVAPLFQRKFGAVPPDVAHHLIGLYRRPDGQLSVLGYSHMRPFGDIYLSGGSCTDGEAIRAMQPEHREALVAAGGIWLHLLKYAFARFHDDCEAFFGYSGDARALQVTAQAGFIDAGHRHLIVHWHKPLHETWKRALIAKAEAIGPF